MEKKPGFSKKLDGFFAGKGFYIVLLLCVTVIGVSTWIMFQGDKAIVDTGDIGGLSASEATETAPVVQEEPATSVWGGEESILSESYEDEPQDALAPEIEQSEPASVTEEGLDATTSESEGEESVQTVAESPVYVWPIYGEIERPFSIEALQYDKTLRDWRVHSGIDVAAVLGAQVMAMGPGKVESVYKDIMLGTTVIVDHGGGLKSVYSNLAEEPPVVAGDGVTAGAVLGSVGNTAIGESGEAVHLHLAMTQDGRPVNPMEYLP